MPGDRRDPQDDDDADDIGIDAMTKTCPNCDNTVRADANFCKYCAHQFEDEDESEPEEFEEDVGLDECPDCGSDLSRIPAERLNDCPICGTDLRALLTQPAEPQLTPADLTECPECGRDISSIPEDMRLVCPSCRVDLEDAIEAQQEAQEEAARARQEEERKAEEERKERERKEREQQEQKEREKAAKADTDESDDSDVEDESGVDTRIEPVVSEVVLSVMGTEIRAGDGDTVGRDIRTAMVKGGAPEDDAVYIHREHARFDLADGEFYMTRLGQNSLKLNGDLVPKGERVRIEDGDEVAFSEVVSADVRLE